MQQIRTRIHWTMALWALGLIIGLPVKLAVVHYTHNQTASAICSIVSIALYMPMLVTSAWGLIRTNRELRQLKRDLHRLETELIVLETLRKIADPEYRRQVLAKDVERLFK